MQKILKVRFDSVTLKQAAETLIQWAQDEDQRYVTTPNPEILLKAAKNSSYRKILNRADLNIADGIGILWAAKYLKITENTKSKWIKIFLWFLSLLTIIIFPPYIKTILPERVTGADLMQKFCKDCPKDRIKIFLLGAEEGVAEKVKKILENKHKGINIAGTFASSPKDEDKKGIIERIKNSGANTLFVAFGAPEQEFWIKKNLKNFKNIKAAMGVGGTFNFIAGTQKRAPAWMQKLGLEWLYRLLQQPSRIIRIFNATIRFPLTILKTNIKRR